MRSTCWLLIQLCFVIRVGSGQETSVEQLFRAAVQEQQRGDLADAIREYRGVLEREPKMVEARVNLGAALADSGQYDEAIKEYVVALPLALSKKPVLMNIARAYYKKGDLQKAREHLQEVHQMYPADQEVSVRLASINLEAHVPAEAVALLQPLDPANQQNQDFQYLYSSALIANGQPQQGVPRLEKLGALAKRADAYLLAGSTLLRYDHPFEARDDLEAALKLDPHLPGIYSLVGQARQITQDDHGAELAFREELKDEPEDFQANLGLGTVLYKRRELREGQRYLENALRLHPENPTAQYQLAMLKSAGGQYERAVEDLEKISKDNPDWLPPHLELAKLYYKLHRTEEGLRERALADKLTEQQQQRGK